MHSPRTNVRIVVAVRVLDTVVPRDGGCGGRRANGAVRRGVPAVERNAARGRVSGLSFGGVNSASGAEVAGGTLGRARRRGCSRSISVVPAWGNLCE